MKPLYRLPQFLSRTAADYGIDFTLGIGGGVTAEELAHALIVCPSIRGVALEDASAQAPVFSALRVAGRRVTLDLDGATAEPSVLQAALAEGLPVLRPAAAWPPSFEVAPPIDAANAEAHPLFYEVMGRLSYDPKSKPEYRAAREIGLWIAAAQQSNLGGSDYVASAGNAGRNASAKFTPPEIAERLDAAAAQAGTCPPGFAITGEARAGASGAVAVCADAASAGEGNGSPVDSHAAGVGSVEAAVDVDAAHRATQNGERGAPAFFRPTDPAGLRR